MPPEALSLLCVLTSYTTSRVLAHNLHRVHAVPRESALGSRRFLAHDIDATLSFSASLSHS